MKKLWREERAPQRRKPAQARETEGLEDWHRVGQTTGGQQEQEERVEGRKEVFSARGSLEISLGL